MKTKEIDLFLNKIALLSGYRLTRTEAIRRGLCVKCGELASKFKDELSQKEYSISGLCQKCQDSYFKE